MSINKFTPGPWKIAADGATIVGANEQAVPGCVVKRMVLGDAHLISAAPDLFTALEELIAVAPAFRAMPVGAPNSEARRQQEAHIAAADAARAALAKARGEKP